MSELVKVPILSSAHCGNVSGLQVSPLKRGCDQREKARASRCERWQTRRQGQDRAQLGSRWQTRDRGSKGGGDGVPPGLAETPQPPGCSQVTCRGGLEAAAGPAPRVGLRRRLQWPLVTWGAGRVWAGAGLVSGRLQLLRPAGGLAIRGLLAQLSCPVFEDCRQVSVQSPDRG